jgi:hypothetical protein
VKRLFTFTLLLLSTIGPFAHSQTIVCGATLSRDSNLSWAAAKKATTSGDPEAAITRLLSAYEASAALWPGAVSSNAFAALRALSDGSATVAGFAIVKSGTDPLYPKQGGFHGETYFVELPIEVDSPLCSDDGIRRARIEFATLSQAISDASGEILAGKIREVAEKIVSLEAAYDRYLFEGFPMFPWEAAVNSWFLTPKHIANGPPRNQIVLMHPAAGIVVATASDAKSDTGATLSIEPLGWVRYAEDHKSWVGFSLLAVFPGDREPGYGVAVNYNMFKLGVTWHDDDTGERDGPAVFLGLDLYQFLGEKYRQYDGYRDRIKALKASSLN